MMDIDIAVRPVGFCEAEGPHPTSKHKVCSLTFRRFNNDAWHTLKLWFDDGAESRAALDTLISGAQLLRQAIVDETVPCSVGK